MLLAGAATLLACGAGEPVASPGRAGAGGAAASGAASTSGAGNAGSAGTAAAGGVAAVGGGSGSGAGGAVAGTGGGGQSGGISGGGQAGQAPSLVGTGTLSYERWEGVKGEGVDLVPIGMPPDVQLALGVFQMPDDVGLDFGARLRGFLTAPQTGAYVFWISCDDNGELSLSTDETPANKRRVAHVTGSPAWTDYVEWSKFPTQKSEPISLVAGQRYYVEALLKEDVAEDHLAIGWSKPDDPPDAAAPFEIIPGKQLSPFDE